MGRLNPQFEDAGTQVLVILGASLEQAGRYAASLHLPFPVLADPERAVYHQYGLDKSFVVIQRTASLLVDREGRIAYIRRATNPNTWLAESKELLAHARARAAEEELKNERTHPGAG